MAEWDNKNSAGVVPALFLVSEAIICVGKFVILSQ